MHQKEDDYKKDKSRSTVSTSKYHKYQKVDTVDLGINELHQIIANIWKILILILLHFMEIQRIHMVYDLKFDMKGVMLNL